MGVKNFNLPDPGEGLVEADIVTWHVKPGDEVKVNDIIVEIETAKSLVELPIPWAGTVKELLVDEGATVDVGTPILSVEVEGAGDADAPAGSAVSAGSADSAVSAGPVNGDAGGGEERVANLVGYGAIAGSSRRRARKASPAVSAPPAAEAAEHVPTPDPEPTGGQAVQERSANVSTTASSGGTGAKPLATPPVRKFAKDKGVDLAAITPAREDGVITRADVEAFIAGGSPTTAEASSIGAQAASYGGGERETRVPIKGVRKMTAQAMVGSAFTAPHVTEFVTVDMTRTMELAERLKQDREFRDVKVTPLLVLAKALLVAIRRNPQVNATWDEAAQEIVIKHYVNLGIAAATPRGLVVPNIKDADRMTMRELADGLGSLVATAREGRTPPADMSGGTITITNVGTFGVDTGTPIINPGESAIVCFGAVRKMPWVVEGPNGDEIVPRQVTQLGLSFDHRLIDGDLGSRFLADIAALLEDPGRALVWG